MLKMEKIISKILIAIDFAGYVITFYEIFVLYSYEFGTLLGLSSLILNAFLYIKKNKEQIIKLIAFKIDNDNAAINESRTKKLYFITVSSIYIIINGALTSYSIFFRDVTFLIMFFIFMGIPICYSYVVSGITSIKEGSNKIYGITHIIIAPFPHYIFLFSVLSNDNLFYRMLGIFITIIFLIPIGIVVLHNFDKLISNSE